MGGQFRIEKEKFNMSIKVGINGFGRIGRMVFRASLNHPEIEIVGINDLCPADYLAYMLKYDTMHGRCEAEIGYTENAIVVNGKEIPVRRQPGQVHHRHELRVQRFLHHQLPGSYRQGSERQVGHQGRPDDHRSLCYRYPEDR